MSVAEEGEQFWDNLATEQDFLDPDAEDAWAHENEEFVDEGDDESATGTSNLLVDGSFGLSFASPTTEVPHIDDIGDADFNAAEVRFCAKKTIFTHHANRCILLLCCNNRPHQLTPPSHQEVDQMPTLPLEMKRLYLSHLTLRLGENMLELSSSQLRFHASTSKDPTRRPFSTRMSCMKCTGSL